MKHNEQRLSSITELTTIEDSNNKPIKLLDTGQRDKERDKDNRDREREWNYKSISQNQITNNHQQPVVNHASHVSRFILRVCVFFLFDFICFTLPAEYCFDIHLFIGPRFIIYNNKSLSSNFLTVYRLINDEYVDVHVQDTSNGYFMITVNGCAKRSAKQNTKNDTKSTRCE